MIQNVKKIIILKYFCTKFKMVDNKCEWIDLIQNVPFGVFRMVDYEAATGFLQITWTEPMGVSKYFLLLELIESCILWIFRMVSKSGRSNNVDYIFCCHNLVKS